MRAYSGWKAKREENCSAVSLGMGTDINVIKINIRRKQSRTQIYISKKKISTCLLEEECNIIGNAEGKSCVYNNMLSNYHD